MKFIRNDELKINQFVFRYSDIRIYNDNSTLWVNITTAHDKYIKITGDYVNCRFYFSIGSHYLSATGQLWADKILGQLCIENRIVSVDFSTGFLQLK